MFYLRHKLILVCAAGALAFSPCFAQSGALGTTGISGSARNDSLLRSRMGVIVGSVRTLNNAPVPDARIEVSSLLHGQVLATQYSSQDGSFVVSNLPPGAYEVRAELGAQEAGERVEVQEGQTWLTVRMPSGNGKTMGGNSGGPTVSVRQLQVPEKAASFLDKAQQAMSKDKLDDAAKYVSKALSVYPDYAQALSLRGILEMQGQQFDKAADDASHAIHADPSNGLGYLIMGAALNAQQKFQDALQPLERAEALMPNAWQGYFESSKALLHLGKFQDSLQKINKAFTLGDAAQHPDLHLVKGYAYMGLQVYGSALSELEQYVNQVPAGPHSAQVRSTLEKIRPLAARPVAR